MLKLVINNTQPQSKQPFLQSGEGVGAKNSFFVNFRPLSQSLYAVSAYDLGHGLACEMNIEIKESYVYSQENGEDCNYLVPMALCNFPSIDTQRLNEKVCWDEYLQGSLMIQFQLKILEQILLFCEGKEATHLTLTLNAHNDDYLEVYRPFALSKEHITTTKDDQIEILMSTDTQTYDNVVDSIEEFDSDFQKTLWRHQKTNPIMRRYIMDYSAAAQL